jgi:hypothetical protein
MIFYKLDTRLGYKRMLRDYTMQTHLQLTSDMYPHLFLVPHLGGETTAAYYGSIINKNHLRKLAL